jgi:hypothetical protein
MDLDTHISIYYYTSTSGLRYFSTQDFKVRALLRALQFENLTGDIFRHKQ